jgi:hypothetical protein
MPAMSVVALLVGLSFASPASAHPAIDRAIEAYRDAAFDDALALLVQAEASSGLSRDDVEEILLWRALVTYANGGEWESDLERLARLDPERVLGPELPPRFRQAFERIRSRADPPLALDVNVRVVEGGLETRAGVTGDPGGLVRAVRIGGRLPGDEWRVSSESALRIAVEDPSELEYFAELVGAGEAVLIARGTESAPLRWSTAPEIEDESGASWVPWVIAGGALIAAGAVVLAIFFFTSDADTRLGAPMPR